MKIKDIIKESEALGPEYAELNMYSKLFLSEQPLGVLVVGDFDGIHTFQEDGTYYVAMVSHNYYIVEGMQECSKVLYDELMKLKMTR